MSLDLHKLQQRDEQEWGMLLTKHYERLKARANIFTNQYSWSEDVASNIIATTYSIRMTFRDITHLVNYMYWSVRHECVELIYQHRISLIESDLSESIDRYTDIFENTHEETFSERLAWDQKRDELVGMLLNKAPRMPKRLKAHLMAWLNCGRQDIAGRLIAVGAKTKEGRTAALQEIRMLIEHKDATNDGSINIDQLKHIITGLNKRQRRALQLLADGMEPKEIMKEIGSTYIAVMQLFGRCEKKLRTVIDIPDHFNRKNVVNTNWDSLQYILQGPMKETIVEALKTDVSHGWKCSKEQTHEIILLRDEQQLPWDEIARHVRLSRKTVIAAYESAGHKRRCVRGYKLTMQTVIEIRKLYATGKYSQSALGRMFGIDGSTAHDIVKGNIWKDALFTTIQNK